MVSQTFQGTLVSVAHKTLCDGVLSSSPPSPSPCPPNSLHKHTHHSCGSTGLLELPPQTFHALSQPFALAVPPTGNAHSSPCFVWLTPSDPNPSPPLRSPPWASAWDNCSSIAPCIDLGADIWYISLWLCSVCPSRLGDPWGQKQCLLYGCNPGADSAHYWMDEQMSWVHLPSRLYCYVNSSKEEKTPSWFSQDTTGPN